jgi:dTDP-4-amino-4,6-dideoxygalactose transaminase
VTRLYLSPPSTGALEQSYILRALESNWLAPVGPDLEAFEQEMAREAGREHAIALSSGTAALHLALAVLGVSPDAEVIVPTLTFVAAANAVRYLGARPVFVDSEDSSWNIDPDLLELELERRDHDGTTPSAVVIVDIYGQCADYDRIVTSCRRRGIPIIEDAAESLGATYGGNPAGSFGDVAVFSFAGNKIVTTSAGGMAVTDDAELAARVRYLANQARAATAHYEHEELGFNYGMSNLLAALGRAQVATLAERVRRRGEINRRYRAALGDCHGVSFQPHAAWGNPNHWLTCLTIDPAATGATRDDVLGALARADIEARPTWKPMHRQPLYRGAPAVITGVADRLFDTGLCLPSGTDMSPAQQDRVIEITRSVVERRRLSEVAAGSQGAQSQRISRGR